MTKSVLVRRAAVTQGAELVVGCPVFRNSIIILWKEVEKVNGNRAGSRRGLLPEYLEWC